MKSKTTIEVNGKRYDAITGAVIGDATTVPVKIKSARSADGLFRSRTAASRTASLIADEPESSVIAVHVKASAPRAAATTRNTNHTRAHAPQAAAVRTSERTSVKQSLKPAAEHHNAVSVNHTKHRVTQNTKTLRRDSVHRPEPSFTRQAHPSTVLQHAVPSLIVPKASVASVDADRLARAGIVQRSPQIAHHNTLTQPLVHPALAPLAVQPEPSVGPAVPIPSTPPTRPGDEEPQAPAPPPAKDNIFDHALANASHFVDVHAHVRHHKRQVRRHLASMAAGTLALVVIAAFAAYQNTPGLQFRVASLRAGISTGTPDFRAAGFALNSASVHSGKLTVSLTNAQGTYSLVQETTNLSEKDMIRTVGATTASGYPVYQTVQAGNVTIYRFANTNATWVNDGVWYTVNGNGPLSDSQLQSLVQHV